MDLPTYTNIWRIEKRLYKLYDFRLPMPLPVGTFGVALGVFALWVVLLSIVNAPFDFGNGWHLVLWVVPPGVITVLATRPVIEGKRLTELLISQARFLTEARVFTRLAPEYEPSEIRVSVRVWHRHPDAGPLPLTRSAARRVQAEEALEPEAEEAADEAADEAAGQALPEERGEARELRAAREAAPPLRGVAAPEPAPVSTRSPVSAPEPASVPEPDDPEDTPARKVPVAAVATSGAQNSARSGNPPSEEAEAVTEQKDENERSAHRAAATDLPDGESPRGVGRRVLNYFGFGLGTPPAGRDHDGGEHGRARGKGDREEPFEDELSQDHDFGEPVYVTEEDEQRDRDEWFAQLRASSGQTPLGLNSKGAYTSSDTGAMSSSELSEAVRPKERSSSGPDGRRRAEEIMSAPEPAARPEPAPEEGAAAARRLRGRAQGIRVAKDLADRRERVTDSEETPGAERERSPVESTGQSREEKPQAAAESAPVRGRARQAPPEEPARAQGRALPATDTGGAAEPPKKDRPQPRRKGRPHAAPWAIGADGERSAKGGNDYPDLSDYAARYAAATGRPAVAKNVSAAPWLPPASADPEGQGPEEEAGPEVTAGPEGKDPSTDQEPQTDDAPGGVGGADRIGRSAAGPQPSHAGSSAPQAKPPLELDHGTGEQAAMPVEPEEEDPGERGPEWTEHMSVLDQHLIKADTPAPPRPKFADAVPSQERDSENGDPSEWFDDGKRHHPDQPRVGDRGNPVIAVSEIREERRAAAQAREQEAREREAREKEAAEQEAREQEARAQEARDRAAREEAAAADRRAAEEAAEAANDPKPSTQLDHGTGELVSFVEVRKETQAEAQPQPQSKPQAELKARTEPEPARRPTETELAEAEEAALRSRRREPAPAPASEAPNGPGTEGAVGHDPHDGVFHRVAQNARRIGQLFGQTAPGEEPDPPKRPEPETSAEAGHGAPSGAEPAAGAERAGAAPAQGEETAKPDLELDHGTGEQDRLGDTPSGVPAQRPGPAPAKPAEPAVESGGTRGWRRLAKVVTGGAAPVRSDLPDSDIERLRSPLSEPRSLVVLGCTGGAGQTVTALMVGHTLAAHRDDRVVTVDVNPGPNGLSRRIGAQAPETLTALLANADSVDEYERMRAYAGRAGTGLEVVQTLDDPYVQTLDDRDYGQLTSLLGGFYGVTLLDPAATGVARALPVADGLVLVAPASADAERAVSMTFEWLDGNGYGNLRANSVLVVNGVSKRSLPDVDAAERVARGRCRAIVRIPWDDHLGSSYTKIDVGALRPATKRAHGALGGVLVNSVAPASTS